MEERHRRNLKVRNMMYTRDHNEGMQAIKGIPINSTPTGREAGITIFVEYRCMTHID
jgi:hypothetical protein